MPLFTWDQSYSVKVSRCDEDHKKLFALIHTLHDAMAQGKGGQIVNQVIADLTKYAKSHFAAEKVLLEKTAYPGLPTHRVQHREFVNRVERFQQELAEGKLGQSIFVAEFLNTWLTNHILNTDQQYSAHLNSNGIR